MGHLHQSQSFTLVIGGGLGVVEPLLVEARVWTSSEIVFSHLESLSK